MTGIKFGTDGWRDMMYDQFNLPNVRRVVRAIAKYVIDKGGKERGVVVGYDARFFSDFFANEAAKILTGYGIKVLLGERDYPTPVVAFAVKHYNAFGAVMFTASHNPPEYNGIKFIPEYAGPATQDITAAIEANLSLVASDDQRIANPSLIEKYNPTIPYLEQLNKIVNVKKIVDSGLNVFIDPMFATGRGFLKELLKGCNVIELNNYRDPLFGGSMPDPQGQFLTELKQKVMETPNSIGLAMDGDADRFGIIDSDGTYLTPNQVITLLLAHLIKNRAQKGVAVRSVATTHMIDKLGKMFGVETIETPVGFKYIGEKMRTHQVIIGGEESGGLSIIGHIPEKDGILACALMAELRAVSQKPLLETLQELYQELGNFYTKRIDLHLDETIKQQILTNIKTIFPGKIGTKTISEARTIDGFKFILENNSWFLVRPSGTEPLIRIYFEAQSIADLEYLTDQVQQMVEQWSKTA